MTIRGRQPLEALEQANGVRAERVNLRRQITAASTARHSRQIAARLLMPVPPRALHSLSALRFVELCRYTGPANARKILRTAHVAEGRRLGELTLRERRSLNAALAGFGGDREEAE